MTEQHYIQSLIILNKVYKESMAAKQKELGISDETLQFLFGNVEEIIVFHQQFLDNLIFKANTWSDTQTVGDVFEKMVPFFKLEIIYCISWSTRLAIINTLKKKKNFNDFLENECRPQHHSGLCIDSYLIQPATRVYRYKLLLHDLIKYTNPIHIDYDKLTTSFVSIREISQKIHAVVELQRKIDVF